MIISNTQIILTNLKLHAYHGVAPQETKIGNTFILNLKLKVDFQKAAITDELESTISYADVFASIKDEMNTPSKLLENAAYRIVKRLFDDYPTIDEIELELNKNNPPMGADIDTAGVKLLCTRQ